MIITNYVQYHVDNAFPQLGCIKVDRVPDRAFGYFYCPVCGGETMRVTALAEALVGISDCRLACPQEEVIAKLAIPAGYKIHEVLPAERIVLLKLIDDGTPDTLADIGCGKMITTVLQSGSPNEIALNFVGRYHRAEGILTLRYWKKAFWIYKGASYVAIDEEELKAEVWRHIESLDVLKTDKKGESKRVRLHARRSLLADVIEAIKAVPGIQISGDSTAVWLDGCAGPDSGQLIPCSNGILDVTSRKLLSSTPSFFTTTAAEVEYSTSPPAPERWLRFVGETWPEDQSAQSALQEMMGYLLTPNTSYQKVFALLGVPRSGKSTIARIVSKLVGEKNTAAVELHNLNGPFGLEQLPGKSIAIAADTGSLGGTRHARAITTEILKKVSGEDKVSINPKGRPAFSIRLSVRFLIISNELPEFADVSGTIAKRLLVLRTTRSVEGNEDSDLEAKLTAELPGILNWALEGLDRLLARGNFVQPESGLDHIAEIQDAAAPLNAFVRDRCLVGPQFRVKGADLYEAYRKHQEEMGSVYVMDVGRLGRNLRAIIPSLERKNPRSPDGERHWVYFGVGLAEPDDDGAMPSEDAELPF